MGWYPCECCGCACLPFESLPTVSISGYTGNGWSGSCCYEQTFTSNTTPSWSKSCSGMLYEGSVTEACTTEHWQRLTPDYRGYEYLDVQPPCSELPEDFCCLDGAEHIATTQTNWTFIDNAFIAVWLRIKHIKVRISQEQVDCTGVEDQTGGCKIVIRSRFVYEYASKIYQNAKTAVTQTVTMINDSCFEVDPAYVIDDAGLPILTCSDVPISPPDPDSPIENCVYEGEIYFDRVKYLDSISTGNLTFENDDIPGCISSSCNYEPYSYVSQVCIYGPSGNIDEDNCIFSTPCYCQGTVTSTNNTATSEQITCLGYIATLKQGCFEDPCMPINCGFDLPTQCVHPGQPPLFEFDCDDFFTASFAGFICSGGGGYRSGIGSDGYQLGVGYFTSNGQLQGIACGGAVNIAPTPYNKTYNCSEAPCDTICCRQYDECPCCPPNCLELYSTGVATIVSHTRSQTCTGLQPASICISAPSWTITIS